MNLLPFVASGIGLGAEDAEKIFSKFEQLGQVSVTGEKGTGLGLNIVQRLIKEGNGALHCHTLMGEGTTFTVYLPGATLTK